VIGDWITKQGRSKTKWWKRKIKERTLGSRLLCFSLPKVFINFFKGVSSFRVFVVGCVVLEFKAVPSKQFNKKTNLFTFIVIISLSPTSSQYPTLSNSFFLLLFTSLSLSNFHLPS